MKRTLQVILTTLLLAPLAALHAAEAPNPKPNIVFILVDDMPYAGPSITGNTLLETPHMDRVAKEGNDRSFLLAPFPQLARAVSSRGALKGELLVRVRSMGRISSRSTSL
jgi:hypothetical protein